MDREKEHVLRCHVEGTERERKVVYTVVEVVVMVVVVDFLVTICPCPVLAAAAPAPFFSLFLSL